MLGWLANCVGLKVGEAGWAEHQAARAVAAASPGGLAKLCRKKWSLTNTKGSGDAMFHVASKVGIVFSICEDDRRECETSSRVARMSGCQVVGSSRTSVIINIHWRQCTILGRVDLFDSSFVFY